ncbi:hypothetical protein C8F04DRAFT_1121206 [Mycena alexandri]|uniref:Uncharacterized protein n=1 Tax=Mycena alexandri TaxID=1745969 RepID=A0AAD6X0N3_9AGAR|nr:hypothetical protein C8F04DRAFT_1121206 [Mycena alexandri]
MRHPLPLFASTSCNSIDATFRALLDEHERQLSASRPLPSLKLRTKKTGENALEEDLDELSELLWVARGASISGAGIKRKREEEFDLNLPTEHVAVTPNKRLRPTPQLEPILGFHDLITNSGPAAKEIVSKLVASLSQAEMFKPFSLRRETFDLPPATQTDSGATPQKVHGG